MGLAKGFRPNLLSGLKLDFDSSLGITTVSGAVSAWANQGYASNNLSMGTAGLRPLYTANLLNGLPGVQFDGVDDRMDFASLVSDTTATIFLVVSGATPNNNGVNACLVTLDKLVVVMNDPNTADGWGAFVNTNVTSGVVLNAAGHVLSNVSRAFNDQDLVTDGVLVHKTNGTSFPARGGSAIGNYVTGGQPTFVTFHRFMLYDRALSVNERKAVEQYLGHRYAISVAA